MTEESSRRTTDGFPRNRPTDTNRAPGLTRHRFANFIVIKQHGPPRECLNDHRKLENGTDFAKNTRKLPNVINFSAVLLDYAQCGADNKKKLKNLPARF